MNASYDDASQVRAIIEAYICAARTNDDVMFEKIFFSDARMFGFLGDESRIVPISNFIEKVKRSTGTAIPDYEATIVSIEVRRSAASAAVLEKNYNGRDFADFFHLLKIGDEWKIVSKTFSHY